MPVLLPDYPFISNRRRSRSRSPSPIHSRSSPHRSGPRTLQLNRGPSPPTPVEEHSRFFFDDEVVCFLVENRMKIRVHKHFLARESSFFRGVFASGPRGPENTYVVDGLSVNEFESLLGFFYDGMFRLSHSNTPIQSFVDLLSISTRFELPKVREHAIAAIDECQSLSSSNTLSPAEMIHIADKHHVEKWLKPAYLTLCEREEPISKEESEKIGIEKVVMIAQARERLLKIKLEDASRMLANASDSASQETVQIPEPAQSSDAQPSGTQPKSRPGWRTVKPSLSKPNLPGFESPITPPMTTPKSPSPRPRLSTVPSWSSASGGAMATKLPPSSAAPPPPNLTASFQGEDIPVPLVEDPTRETGSRSQAEELFKEIFGMPSTLAHPFSRFPQPPVTSISPTPTGWGPQ
ncbi:hypothetical protein V5O48_002073 [Marasmius crinis-equi]|uniref:BTB domain-containing protein n=1 Tax=Marasmius crinis-equi TaxID=585013 RepID=A0ABR3FWL5_9AGAR